jgi:hypothetical protein
VRRQGLRRHRREGVRRLGRLHNPHQGQSQKAKRRASTEPRLLKEGLSGEEMEGGAHDFVVNQATQPANSLVKEGRELAGVDSLSLRPYIAQLGGFRIESMSIGITKVPPLLASARRRWV